MKKTRLVAALGLTAALLLTSCAQSGAGGEASTSAPSAPAAPSAPSAPSGSASASPPAPPTAAPSPSTAPGRRTVVTVTGKQVSPAPATVDIGVGELLTIVVTSDQDNTLHAHGFEIAKDIKAGQRAEVTIKGAKPGVYEFELHDPELRLLQVAVR